MNSVLRTGLAILVAAAAAGACKSVDRSFGDAGTGGMSTGGGTTSGSSSSTSSSSSSGTTTSVHCTDGLKDGDETDVDCGGSCTPCAFGLGCSAGTDCASTYCTAGACSALVLGTVPSPNCDPSSGCSSSGSGIHQMAVDATSVYVTCYGTYGATDGSLVSLPVGGGTVTTLASSLANPTGIAVDASNVYWTENAFGTSNGTVSSIPLAGGVTTPIATGQPYADKLTLVGTTLYWTNDAPSSMGTVESFALGGSSPSALAMGLKNPDAIACDSTNCYFTTGGDPSDLYSVPVGGGTPSAVALAQHSPITVAVDSAGFYWSEYSPTNVNHVSSAPLAGGTPNILVTLAVGSGGSAVATDDSYVYWIENTATSHQIRKVPKLGGTPTLLATGNFQALGLVLDDAYAYWVSNADGTVRRVHK